MVDSARKKDLVRAYAERKQVAGVFAVRAPGHVWTGTSRNLATAQNGIWFGLRTGSYTNKDAQAAWNAHGEAAFAYDVLEEIIDDNPQMIGLLLKERETHWRSQLGAGKIAG
jgi:hypothetical protein